MIEHIEQGTLPAHIKACIALTSWKKRINTVGLTIYNLFETCGPDFHIVLTLAEEEFPKKERELPRDLVLMNRAGVFEILWVKKNYKAFKKWIFCAKRYQRWPIISADDDCVYIYNFAEYLYKFADLHKCSICTYDAYNVNNRHIILDNKNVPIRGPATLYYNNTFTDAVIKAVEAGIFNITVQDDNVYDAIASTQHIIVKRVDKSLSDILCFHDNNDALGDIYE